MSQVFEQNYAEFYDFFYQEKDYAAECDMLEAVFGEFGAQQPKRILDLGCGTGGHSLLLSERGYVVTGVDRSEHMLRIAEEKAKEVGQSISFKQSDVRELELKQKFDAVLAMFAVLGYQLSNEDVRRALRVVGSHLQPGGLFVFDVWFGPAVLSERPTVRVKTVAAEEGAIHRTATPALDVMQHQCTVEYQTQLISGESVLKDDCETHRMRYFFPLELETFLKGAGLELRHMGDFSDYRTRPSEKTWNVLVVAQKNSS